MPGPSLPDDAVRTLDDGTLEVALSPETFSVRVARQYVDEVWNDLDDDVLHDVGLIVTELVANAVQHGAPDISLRLRNQSFAIDVAVVDHGGGWPRRKSAEEIGLSQSGRGLAIVDRLSAAWGVDPVDGDGPAGKVVWASVDRI